jgi:hypothetical protein
MNPGDVLNAVRPDGASSEAEGTGKSVRCIQQFALSVALRLWCPSGLAATGPCTVATASAQ